MEEDEELVLLSPEDKLREQAMFSRFAMLMRDERSRYLKQAKELLSNKSLITENELYRFRYYVKEGNFLCNAKPKSKSKNWFSTGCPIPFLRRKKIERLVELFAQCEAGQPEDFE